MPERVDDVDGEGSRNVLDVDDVDHVKEAVKVFFAGLSK
jgi:hypothetical protein